MIRTFLDSGVLLSAARSVSRDRERSLQVLEDPQRVFVTSPFVHLEVSPKAIFYKKLLEQAFYRAYFEAAEWVDDVSAIEREARKDAARFGLAAMDALHVAAAKLGRADELVTTERPVKALYRSTSVRIVPVFE
jgi:predicted nucleic acid-binding protein